MLELCPTSQEQGKGNEALCASLVNSCLQKPLMASVLLALSGLCLHSSQISVSAACSQMSFISNANMGDEQIIDEKLLSEHIYL